MFNNFIEMETELIKCFQETNTSSFLRGISNLETTVGRLQKAMVGKYRGAHAQIKM